MAEMPKTNEEWRGILEPMRYHVLREKGTERAFTGEYWNHKEKGVYRCAGCGAELFDSSAKFDSRCGWPSFYEALDPEKVEEHVDLTHGMRRVEVTCKQCGGHLGHIFPDAPQTPTGMRYCINSASLEFDPAS
ncbi:peptide-methionine (R)-S-oxide reductase MsrB [Fimbriimonas ginsengisoli]|uniref:Peptide methionine sulfoxide reductase MsrB n=1 Tax=Fimbriimonas ginsengisoli Gsoil 348 TaxID=661478 RepID=A0A068NW79_FIMGI|nr:peptide-methionine (R)-S-oxide reductase MsrB [Fimbriimonas ginsengisoli]AIE87788.1 methionine-r-sulfoxide reductase [Fimbriimonas ginsengisoli Gsoil 348]